MSISSYHNKKLIPGSRNANIMADNEKNEFKRLKVMTCSCGYAT